MPAASRSVDLVAERQRDLPADLLARDIVAHERPLQHGHRPGEHPFHRPGGQRLGVGRPAHRHRLGPGDVGPDDRRGDASAAVALHPAVPGEGEAAQLLAEILDHVVALELAVHQHVEPQFLLPAHRVADPALDRTLVFGRGHVAAPEGRPRAAHLRRLREGADGRGRERRQGKPRALAFPAFRDRRSRAAPSPAPPL